MSNHRKLYLTGLTLIALCVPACLANAQTNQEQPPANKAMLRSYVANVLRIKSGYFRGTFHLNYKDERMNWYFCDLGLMPLVTSNNQELILLYLQQYIRNFDDDGSVFDLNISFSDNSVVLAKSPDSFDAYAATFLSLASKYHRVFPQDQWWFNVKVRERLKQIARRGVICLKMPSGLIAAKPTYRVGYLMDNCQDYRGLMDFAEALASDHDADADEFRSAALSIANAITAKLFDPIANRFLAADAVTLPRVYPELTCQVFPQLLDVPLGSAEETKKKYTAGWNYFIAGAGDWQDGNPTQDGSPKGDSFGGYPWMILGEAAAKRGEVELARTQLNHYLIKMRSIESGNAAPEYASIQEIGAAIEIDALINSQ